jgi:[acyl-carrier-protein] S-malonyltransferase
MLSTLAETFSSTIKPLLDQLDSTLPGLRNLLFNGPPVRLTNTPNAQPAVLFTSICILRVLQQNFNLDISKFDYHLGHSLGEFTALVAADILSLPTALQLVHKRGLAMEAATKSAGKVGMYALVVGKRQLKDLSQHIQEFIDSEALADNEFLSIANINSSAQVVVSGHVTAVEKCMCQLRQF